MDLYRLRAEIDRVDKELLRLFNLRMDIVRQVAEYKKQAGLPILNAQREQSIINGIYAKAKPEIKCETAEIFKALMEVSRWYQQRIIAPESKFEFAARDTRLCLFDRRGEGCKVAFQGVPGSYSEEAAMSCLPKAELFNVESFEDVFNSVENGRADYGIVPIENSSTGAIVEIYDMLKNKGFYIVGEKTVKVEHNLMGVKDMVLSGIKEVYSHPQGLRQCAQFLKNLGVKTIPVMNTALAAKLVSEAQDKTKAAIASENAARLYGLDILQKGIQDSDNNFTRFIIISKRLEIASDAEKISVMFSVPHVSGSLYRVLAHFSYNKLNLLKIESRPVMGRKWEYVFFLDFAGSLHDEATAEVVGRLSMDTGDFTLLGNYPTLD